MHIAIIANNYGENYDGIGAFSKVVTSLFTDKVTFDVFTSKCNEKESKVKRITTLGMTRLIIMCTKRISDYKAILLEYPFVEWNPLIIFAFSRLAKEAKLKNIKLYLSIHEYARVNKLRQMVIRSLVRKSDLVFVSNTQMKHDLQPINSRIVLRGIPTNIYGEATKKSVDSLRKYVFFGLINGTKAFEEMLEGWDRFNTDGTNILYVLSSSNLTGIERHKEVIYIKNADNSTIFKYMNGSMFSLLPIKPLIDEKNATFKTGAIAGCICIGKFCDSYKNEDFILNMQNYTSEDFYRVLCDSKKIEYKKACEMSEKSLLFGEAFNPRHIARIIENVILEGNVIV